jgi:Glyoxalase-like domain
VEPPLEFSRPVELPDGPRDATFRTVRLTPGTVPAGRIYFCHHFTRDLVWRDEWRHHANGTVGVMRAVIAARDPSVLGALFARMFGQDAVRPTQVGCSLTVGLSQFDVMSRAGLAAEFGDAVPADDGRDDTMAALTLRTRSLEAASAALAAGRINAVRREADRIIVPATETFGVTLEFRM